MKIGIEKNKWPLKFLQAKTNFFCSLPFPSTLPRKYSLPSFCIVQDQFVKFRGENIIVFQVLDLIKSIKKIPRFRKRLPSYVQSPIPWPSVDLSLLEKVKVPAVCRLVLRQRRRNCGNPTMGTWLMALTLSMLGQNIHSPAPPHSSLILSQICAQNKHSYYKGCWKMVK